jgi:hypothetical protein
MVIVVNRMEVGGGGGDRGERGRSERRKKKVKGQESRTGKEGKKEKRVSWAGGEERKRWEDGDGRFSRLAREIGNGQLAIAVGSS